MIRKFAKKKSNLKGQGWLLNILQTVRTTTLVPTVATLTTTLVARYNRLI